MKTVNVTMLILVLAWGASAAQVQVDKTLPATPTGEVGIESAFGSIEVLGWERDEVAVTGTLAPSAIGFELEGDEDEVWVEVEVPDVSHYDSDSSTDFESHIVVHVPRGSSIAIETIAARIEVRDVGGTVEIESISGPITVSGDPRVVEIESISGEITIDAMGAPMEIETVSGAVTLTGVKEAVSVESVSGPIDISGQNLAEIDIESVTGNVRFDGSLAPAGDLDIEAHGGNVEILLPAGVKANFEFATYSGKIESDIGPKPRKGVHDPYMELRFSSDVDAEFDVSVETFSGNITLGLGGGM